MTSITFGNRVTYIGNYAFSQNRLTSVIIPNSVTTIGQYVFSDNELISVTIGTGVTLVEFITLSGGRQYSFGYSFEDVYNNEGKQAGTYTRPNERSEKWTRQ